MVRSKQQFASKEKMNESNKWITWQGKAMWYLF
jgi:hypothetical protein